MGGIMVVPTLHQATPWWVWPMLGMLAVCTLCAIALVSLKAAEFLLARDDGEGQERAAADPPEEIVLYG